MTVYALDPTGVLSANLIENEVIDITSEILENYGFVIPLKAPFYKQGLSITYIDHQGMIRSMVEDVDYTPMFRFIGATESPSNFVFGAIGLLKQNLVSQITIRYQTFGGLWNIDKEAIRMYIANGIFNPNTMMFDLVPKQQLFIPLQDAEWHLNSYVNVEIAQSYNLPITMAISTKYLSEVVGAKPPSSGVSAIYNQMINIAQKVAADKADVTASKVIVLATAVNVNTKSIVATAAANAAAASEYNAYLYSAAAAASAAGTNSEAVIDGGNF